MINSVSRIMASNYRNNTQNNSTSFNGRTKSPIQPQAVQSPISGIVKSLRKIPFLKGFLQ